jgi:hypothetical protein
MIAPSLIFSEESLPALTHAATLLTYPKSRHARKFMTEIHHPDRSDYADSTFGRSNRNHREDINRARQAAEALFAPRHWVAEPAAPVPVASTGQTPRKPRILSAVPVQPTCLQAIEPSVEVVSPKKREKIPAAHFARIRTWLKHGMTVPQVADVYGVTIGEIEIILQKT